MSPLLRRTSTALALTSASLGAQFSSLVFPGANGKLQYVGYANEGQATEGNLMIDFSRAGYEGGGVAIPWVPVELELNPVAGGGDDHARIQAAIDTISALPLSSAGFRGALLLKAGAYHVSETLNITASGVVIRGEGQGTNGTVITFTATQQDHLFAFEGNSGWNEVGGTDTPITNTLVPSGVKSFRVGSASHFSVGDSVVIHRTPNTAWINDLGMDQWGWTASSYRSWSPRTIRAINGNTITLDAPLVHAIESEYGGGEVYRYNFDAISQVGIERIRIESSYTSDTDEDHGWDAVQFRRAKNAWARQVTAKYFGHSCVFVDDRSQHITVEDCAMLDPKSLITGQRRYSFLMDDSCFVLMQRCYADLGRHDFITDSKMGGPSVFVDGLAERTLNDIGPHHRYAEGILFDNIKGDEIHVQNRTNSGTGHGWAGTQTVFWNCEADSLICDAPKGAMNFAIGCVGSQEQGSFAPGEPFGFWESQNIPVNPRSLYYKQLEDRLGTQAMSSVTTAGQRQGTVWNALASWAGEGEAPGLPSFSPLQVEASAGAVVEQNVAHQLSAVVRYPLPANFPASTSWSVVSGPGEAVFDHAASPSSAVTFSRPGSYLLQYVITQDDDRDPNNVITYQGSDTVAVIVSGGVSPSEFNPVDFTSIGTITNSTGALTFDTDSLQLSGGLNGSGELAANDDGSLVAFFAFEDIDLTAEPTILGSRPLVIASHGDLRIATAVIVSGSNGAHTVQGSGTAGGGDGGDANRSETAGFPYGGQGLGGSLGNTSGNEDSSSGGGGFGGAGGNGTTAGGASYGDRFLNSLSGGSGAGGTRNKGGGAGGGGIALVASGSLEIASGSLVEAAGGRGSSSSSQFTSGGGSGGGILINGKEVVIQGALNADGGDGGPALGGQLNGGGGGGGRIAVYYHHSLDLTGSTVSADGGVASGSNVTGQDGAVGSIFYGLNNAGIADQWLTSETGIMNPSPSDWLMDYDNDGVIAHFEYAFGGSTSTFDRAILPLMRPDGAGGFEIVFNRRERGISPSDYIIETSTTLQSADWQSFADDDFSAAAHATLSGFEEVLVPLPPDEEKRFFRMKIR